MERKAFGYITTKTYGGKSGDKTFGIHFKAEDLETVKFATSLIKALAHGEDIDITAFTYKKLRNGKTRITITSPK
jgi:hypothetical protein